MEIPMADPVSGVNPVAEMQNRTNVLFAPLVTGSADTVDNIVSDIPDPLNFMNAQMENINLPEL